MPFRRPVTRFIALLAIVAMIGAACAPRQPTALEEDRIMLSLRSPIFQDGQKIPVKYTCDGQDISPPLAWSEPPTGAQAFALIMDDPDAPGRVFTHWVVFNLPADTRELSEALPTEGQLTSGALQGKNDFGKIGYGGPCPPPGPAHRYRFTLYALDQSLDLPTGVSKGQVLKAMEGHILAQGLLTGVYQR